MDTSIGEIGIPAELRAKFMERNPGLDPDRFISPVNTVTRRQAVTGQVLAYEPCPCGSGHKFKFCCYQKAADQKTALQFLRAEILAQTLKA
jgi:hypothetical protein